MVKPNNRGAEHGKSMIIVVAFLITLSVVLMVRLFDLQGQQQANAETIEILQAQKEQEELRHKELVQRERYMQTDAFVEDTARELLNLVKPGDTTIKPDKH